MSTPNFQRFQQAFCSHIRNPAENSRPKGVAARGMRVYNEIVFNNLNQTLSACFPVCRKILGVRRWKRMVREFMSGHRCKTPLFRQIPEEFLRWLESTANSADPPAPAFFLSLAHYEWVELAVALSEASPAAGMAQDILDGKPTLTPASALLRYDYPVHRISPRFKPSQPGPDKTHLLVFRDQNDKVSFIELSPVSFRLLELLQEGKMTGRQALQRIAEETQHPDPSAVVQFGIQLLQDLEKQGALRGCG